MKNPDEESSGTDSDSTEFENDFDFIIEGSNRLESFL